MKTRDKILSTAKELFTRYGACNITTNHIAAELGISTGNLYYHFRNKEEIIRQIWYIQTSRLDPVWQTPNFGTSELVITEVFLSFFELFYEYRFFYRELPVLLNKDPILKKEYSERTQKILSFAGTILDSWISVGIMKNINSDQERALLIKNAWMIGELWITYNYILYDEATEDTVKEGIYQYYSILKPYFTSSSRRKIEKYINI